MTPLPHAARSDRAAALEAENAALRAILQRVLDLPAEYRSVYETHRRAGLPAATDPTQDVVDGVERVARKVQKMLDVLPSVEDRAHFS